VGNWSKRVQLVCTRQTQIKQKRRQTSAGGDDDNDDEKQKRKRLENKVYKQCSIFATLKRSRQSESAWEHVLSTFCLVSSKLPWDCWWQNSNNTQRSVNVDVLFARWFASKCNECFWVILDNQPIISTSFIVAYSVNSEFNGSIQSLVIRIYFLLHD